MLAAWKIEGKNKKKVYGKRPKEGLNASDPMVLIFEDGEEYVVKNISVGDYEAMVKAKGGTKSWAPGAGVGGKGPGPPPGRRGLWSRAGRRGGEPGGPRIRAW